MDALKTELVPLTEADIQKIALYIPFGVRFSSMAQPRSFFSKFYGKGMIGTTVVSRYDEDMNIEDSSDISCLENDDRPILRKLIDWTDEEFHYFISLKVEADFSHDNSPQRQFLEYPEAFFYALSKHFDVFGLISQGKAIDYNYLTTKQD